MVRLSLEKQWIEGRRRSWLGGVDVSRPGRSVEPRPRGPTPYGGGLAKFRALRRSGDSTLDICGAERKWNPEGNSGASQLKSERDAKSANVRSDIRWLKSWLPGANHRDAGERGNPARVHARSWRAITKSEIRRELQGLKPEPILDGLCRG
jgi:hypothetical protein